MPFAAYDAKALRLLSTAHIGVMEEVKAKGRLNEAETTNASRRTSLILMRVFDQGERDVASLTRAGLNGISATSEQSLRRAKPSQPVTQISRRKTRLDAVSGTSGPDECSRVYRRSRLVDVVEKIAGPPVRRPHPTILARIKLRQRRNCRRGA